MIKLPIKTFRFYSFFYTGILFFFFPPFSYSIDINNKKFSHLTTLDGLSSNNVLSILKDNKGYIWLGTANGLNRYDGHEIKTFKPDKSVPNSITGKIILDLTTDNNGDIWISTDSGLNIFEVRTETFKSFSHDNNASNNAVYNPTYKLLINDDSLWFGSENGLFNLDLNSRLIKNIFNEHPVYDIELDNDILWLTSRNRIFKYSLESGELNEYLLPIPTTVENIFRHNNTLWLGTWEGIIHFDITTHTLNLKNRLLPGVTVHNMTIDDIGNVWIGTRNVSLYIYSIPNNRLENVFTSETDTFHLRSTSIFTIMIDDNNRLWIGSTAGLSHTSLNHSLYFLQTAGGQLIDNTVTNIIADQSNDLWVTTIKGVTRY